MPVSQIDLTKDVAQVLPVANGGAGGSVNAQLGTSYTVAGGDSRKLVYLNNASAVAVAVDPSSSLGSTFFCWLENLGAGTVTVTPNGSETIDGGSSLTLAQNEGLMLFSDGSNLFTSRGKGGTGGSFTAGGDLSGTSSSQTVVGWKGKALDSSIGSPSNGDSPVYDSTLGKWKAAAPSGGSPASGTCLCYPNRFTTGTGSWVGFSLFALIAGNTLYAMPSSWAILMQVASGSGTVGAMVILRTLRGSTTVVDSTAVKVGGASSFTLSSGFTTTDAISLALDSSHDYWVVVYFSAGSTLNVASNGTVTAVGPGGGYVSGDHTADTTIPTRTNPLDAYLVVGIYNP